jgi:hypothetical protein
MKYLGRKKQKNFNLSIKNLHPVINLSSVNIIKVGTLASGDLPINYTGNDSLNTLLAVAFVPLSAEKGMKRNVAKMVVNHANMYICIRRCYSRQRVANERGENRINLRSL